MNDTSKKGLPSRVNENATYPSSELEIFAEATNWKNYYSQKLHPYISGDVLEVGSGLGTNTEFLQKHWENGTWYCCEPDPELLARSKKVEGCKYFNTRLGGFSQDLKFDTIIYIDVLEHIKHSRDEIELITRRLRPRGNLIILVPAQERLFNSFDTAIGHYRRYSKLRLREDYRGLMRIKHIGYYDSLGLIASIANKLFFKKSEPTRRAVLFWDRILVPCSKILDPLIAFRAGKSLIAVLEIPELSNQD